MVFPPPSLMGTKATMSPSDLSQAMQDVARRMTAGVGGVHEMPRMIETARSLGLKVSLQLYNRSAGRGVATGGSNGILNYGPMPEVIIYRSASNTLKSGLSPKDEHLLSVRERFTLAHEIAHWVAWKNFDIEPEETGKPTYWEHESVMNTFAGILLIPDSRLSEWLAPFGQMKPVTIHHALSWARASKVSTSTAVRRIADAHSSITFLKLAIGTEKESSKLPHPTRRIIEILESAHSPNMHTANDYARVRNDRMVNLFSSSDQGNLYALRGTSFDGKTIQSLYVCWRRISDKKLKLRHLQGIDKAYWTSWIPCAQLDASEGKSSKDAQMDIICDE